MLFKYYFPWLSKQWQLDQKKFFGVSLSPPPMKMIFLALLVLRPEYSWKNWVGIMDTDHLFSNDGRSSSAMLGNI